MIMEYCKVGDISLWWFVVNGYHVSVLASNINDALSTEFLVGCIMLVCRGEGDV